MADYNETLRALRRDAAELERIAGGTGAYWTGAAAENFRRQFPASWRTCWTHWARQPGTRPPPCPRNLFCKET